MCGALKRIWDFPSLFTRIIRCIVVSTCCAELVCVVYMHCVCVEFFIELPDAMTHLMRNIVWQRFYRRKRGSSKLWVGVISSKCMGQCYINFSPYFDT